MLSVGIDVSKEKSTVCGMHHLGEIVFGPFEIAHTESDLSDRPIRACTYDCAIG